MELGTEVLEENYNFVACRGDGENIRIVALSADKAALDVNKPADSFEEYCGRLFEKRMSVIEKIDFKKGEYRKAFPVIMTLESCARCHAHENQKVGNVLGTLIITLKIES